MGNEKAVNQNAAAARHAVQGKMKVTPSEAFVETIVASKVTDVFGIVGSA